MKNTNYKRIVPVILILIALVAIIFSFGVVENEIPSQDEELFHLKKQTIISGAKISMATDGRIILTAGIKNNLLYLKAYNYDGNNIASLNQAFAKPISDLQLIYNMKNKTYTLWYRYKSNKNSIEIQKYMITEPTPGIYSILQAGRSSQIVIADRTEEISSFKVTTDRVAGNYFIGIKTKNKLYLKLYNNDLVPIANNVINNPDISDFKLISNNSFLSYLVIIEDFFQTSTINHLNKNDLSITCSSLVGGSEKSINVTPVYDIENDALWMTTDAFENGEWRLKLLKIPMECEEMQGEIAVEKVFDLGNGTDAALSTTGLFVPIYNWFIFIRDGQLSAIDLPNEIIYNDISISDLVTIDSDIVYSEVYKYFVLASPFTTGVTPYQKELSFLVLKFNTTFVAKTDIPGDGTPGYPYNTLKDAVENSADGHFLRIEDGTFVANEEQYLVNVEKLGIPNYLIIFGVKEGTIIGPGWYDSDTEYDSCFSFTGGGGGKVYDIKFERKGKGGGHAINFFEPKDDPREIIVKNVQINNFSNPIMIQNAVLVNRSIIIINNKILNFNGGGSNGININFNGLKNSTLDIMNNVILSGKPTNGTQGIIGIKIKKWNDIDSECRIEGNIIEDTSSNPIIFYNDAKNIEITNNIFWSNTNIAFQGGNMQEVKINNNFAKTNFTINKSGVTLQDWKVIAQKPYDADYHLFNLQCIDGGQGYDRDTSNADAGVFGGRNSGLSS